MADSHLIERLQGIVDACNVLEGEPMSAHTSFRIGGPVTAFVIPQTRDQAVAAITACREADEPLYILGHGSNLLVADEGLDGIVVQLSGNLASVEIEGGSVIADAGASNAKVAAAACRAGLAGFEFAAGIPGTIGGAAMMNAGAYGGEFRDVAVSVDCLMPDGSVATVSAEEAGWGYRTSKLSDDGSIVLSARICLEPDDAQGIQARMDDLAQRRRDKQPLDLPSAGSTFKRPEGDFAGRLIQEAGMQGHRVGDAQVSTKHAGFVVNLGKATASDVRQVIADVQEAVDAQFGVRLQPEVKFWGFR